MTIRPLVGGASAKDGTIEIDVWKEIAGVKEIAGEGDCRYVERMVERVVV
jgi:hypothetical protein